MADKYHSYADLAAVEEEGRDYSRTYRLVEGARAIVIAPHGGNIEPHTGRLANSLASSEFSFYCFSGKAGLHITSCLFDEPICVELVAKHDYVLSIHGWGAPGKAVAVGGLDTELSAEILRSLSTEGLDARRAVGSLSARSPKNITNRGARGMGVQLELTMALRKDAVQSGVLVRAIRTLLLALPPPTRDVRVL